ncbi:MAG: helix-turn-helix domain-containing protein [Lacrimispora saccharolytica]
MVHDRIKEIRISLGLNQSDFGNKIGLGQAGVSALEKGIRGITDRNIQLICEKFNVNEEWLRNGEGEMFLDVSEEDEFMKAATELRISGDEGIMQAVIEYWKMSPEQREIIKNFIINIGDAYKKDQKKE